MVENNIKQLDQNITSQLRSLNRNIEKQNELLAIIAKSLALTAARNEPYTTSSSIIDESKELLKNPNK